MSLLPIPSNAAKFISQLQKQMLTYTNISQNFVPKTVLNNQLVRAFRNNERRKHRAIGYFTSTDVYQGITRIIIPK